VPGLREEGLQESCSGPQVQLKGSGWYATDFKTPQERREEVDRRPIAKSEQVGKRRRSEDGSKPRPRKRPRRPPRLRRAILDQPGVSRAFFVLSHEEVLHHRPLIWIPIVVTIWVLKFIFGLLDQSLLLLRSRFQPRAGSACISPASRDPHCRRGVRHGLPGDQLRRRATVQLWHDVLNRIPVVNSIYSSVKQISDTLFSSSGPGFRRRCWCSGPHEARGPIAFLTARRRRCRQPVPPDCLSVYVPTTPNRTGAISSRQALRRGRARHDGDQALKYIISMGVVPPQK